jgi:FtsP/CotA-like multicopper oxidase with cupredoxin domain
VVKSATREQSGRFCRAWSDPADVPDCVTGMAPVEANQRGPRDTVRANPGQVKRIKARFDRPGDYVWHCHILEHGDNNMMRPYKVVV